MRASTDLLILPEREDLSITTNPALTDKQTEKYELNEE
jgi:hypothetical protein